MPFEPADRAAFNAKILKNYDEVTVRHSERSGWTCRIKHTVEAHLVQPGENTPEKPGYYKGQLDLSGDRLLTMPAVIERSSRCINLAVARAIDDALHNRWKKPKTRPEHWSRW